jgi:transposase-like protein
MTRPIERDAIYRGRRFQTETIELCVRWYITYRLSYRDLAAMMAERGIIVSHTTIMRWVLRYVPEYEKRWGRFARPVNASWRMDETAVSVRGGLHYLYRAVDKKGKSVGSLLRADRGTDAAQEFFRKALASNRFRWPTTVNLDGNAASHRALRLLGNEDPKWRSVVVRCCRYLNNVVEQDHRAIKRRCASMLGLKSFKTAAITFAGIELANRIRKRQYSFGCGDKCSNWSQKQLWDRALAPSSNLDPQQDCSPPDQPPMHQNSRVALQRKSQRHYTDPKRCAHKIVDGRGLYLLVAPNGSRYWRYNYRFEGKHKTLALGVHPDISLEKARARHQIARTLLADGVDPSAWKRAIGASAFTLVGKASAHRAHKGRSPRGHQDSPSVSRTM